MRKSMLNLIAFVVFTLQFISAFRLSEGSYLQSPSQLILLIAGLVSAIRLMAVITAYLDARPSVSVGLKAVVPSIFAMMLVMLWQSLVLGFAVSPVLLPSIKSIVISFVSNMPLLWADFQQTYLKAVLAGYVLGCSSGFVVAQLASKSQFLRNGLLPLGNFMSAIPIVGIAPIMVMWFGFDWQSKAAVIVVMTFFPMFINTLAGLQSVDHLHQDLLHTYGASSNQRFVKCQFFYALPFVFNALKLNSTLALIGAIVAEFFGTPIVGMGFRISTEVGRMNMDMVWATILVAALAGSMSYGLLALLEKRLLFWHPSVR